MAKKATPITDSYADFEAVYADIIALGASMKARNDHKKPLGHVFAERADKLVFKTLDLREAIIRAIPGRLDSLKASDTQGLVFSHPSEGKVGDRQRDILDLMTEIVPCLREMGNDKLADKVQAFLNAAAPVPEFAYRKSSVAPKARQSEPVAANA